MKFTRKTALFTCLCICLLILSACSSNGATQSTTSTFGAVDQSIIYDNGTGNPALLSASVEGDLQLSLQKGDWKLTWNDEFNDESADIGINWAYDLGNGFYFDGDFINGWGNNELQCYTDHASNVYLEDGSLVIRAIKEDASYTAEGRTDTQQCSYTSARIKTKGKFAQTYGRYEIRAKLPAGIGLWPAIWMLSEDDEYGSWAASGEIDIMENNGNTPETVLGTLHYGAEFPYNTSSGDEYHFPEGTDATDFHVYALEWEPGEIRWYVDNVLTQTQNAWYTQSDPIEHDLYDYPAPFNKDFHLIMNLAIGGNFLGNPAQSLIDKTMSEPKKMEIDYVRIYAKDSYTSDVEPPEIEFPWLNESRPSLAGGNLIYDSSFDWNAGDTIQRENGSTFQVTPDSSYWKNLEINDGEHTISTEHNVLEIDVTNEGTAFFSNQILHEKLTIEKGFTYTVSFHAGYLGSVPEKNIMVKLGAGEERGWANFSGDQYITLHDDFNAYEFSFDMNDESHTLSRLEFNLGAIGTGKFYFDNVVVKKTGEVLPPTMRSAVAGGNLVYNGGFDWNINNSYALEDANSIQISADTPGIPDLAGSSFWSFYAQPGHGGVDLRIEENKFLLSVDAVDSGNDWHLQLMNQGIPILQGASYTLSFTANVIDDSISQGRKITALVGEIGKAYTRFGQTQVVLTDTPTEYSFDFTMGYATDLEAMVQFLLADGIGDYTLIIDDVSLTMN